LLGERLSERLAGVDAELLVDMPQVVLDYLRAEEQRRRGLARRPSRAESRAEQEGDR
jgi:hypothetical protein